MSGSEDKDEVVDATTTAPIVLSNESDMKCVNQRIKSINDDIESKVCSTVQRIVDNIKNGDCPVRLLCAYVVVQNPSNMSSPKAVAVVCFHSGFATELENADMRLLTKLCDDPDECGMTVAMLEQERTGVTVSKAVQNLVDIAAANGEICLSDVPRLKSLFGIWMKGVTWKKCRSTPSYHPSQGTWKGFPWDSYNVIARSLNNHINCTNVVVGFERGILKDIVEDDVIDKFQLVWKADAVVQPDVKTATLLAIELARNAEGTSKKRRRVI